MRSWRVPRTLRPRWPLALLLAAFGITGLAAVEAQRAVRSNALLADRALREYASFTAWSFQQHLREAFTAAAREALGAVNHSDNLHTGRRVPAAGELVHYLPWSVRCECHIARLGPLPASFFAFVLGSDTLGVALNRYVDPEHGWIVDEGAADSLAPAVRRGEIPNPYSPPERAWINDTVSARIRSGVRSETGYQYLIGEFAGRSRFFSYVLMPTVWGDTVVYGAEYGAEAMRALLSGILDSRGLLPEAFTNGRPNRDLLHLEVLDARGRQLFASAPTREWRLDNTNELPPAYGGMLIHAQIRPELAGQLIIGGLPRSRLPFLIGLLALAASLSIVAVMQLRREEELARLRADFVASVSHELRTPLSQIRLFLDTLRLGRFVTDEQRKRSLDLIDRETTRLGYLVENVLRFSRAGSGRRDVTPRERVQVADETAAIIAEFEPLAAARRARVMIDVAGAEGVEVLVRPGALRQVLLNLLENAVKYGPPGQTVRVTLCANDRVVLLVDDEGPGVPAAERDAIWRPFQRGTAARRRGAGGSGIGLTIVREIVEDHAGRVRIEEAPGGGARFVVELPFVSRPVHERADERRPPPAPLHAGD